MLYNADFYLSIQQAIRFEERAESRWQIYQDGLRLHVSDAAIAITLSNSIYYRQCASRYYDTAMLAIQFSEGK